MSELAKYIENTILKPDTTLSDAQRYAEDALRFNYAAICIPPLYVRESRRILGERSRIKLATAVGYPLGYAAISAKSDEIKRAMDEGADEINAVLNVSAVKSGLWNQVHRDMDGLVLATRSRGGILKLMLELSLLTNEELDKICQMARETEVPWLAAGTGFSNPAPDVETIRGLRARSGDLKIMAAGASFTESQANALINEQVDRLSVPNAVALV